MTDRIENAWTGDYVADKRPFLTYNKTLMGDWQNDTLYAAHSYGRHFPIYAYDKTTDTWFGNKDKVSRTTSKHQSLAYPKNVAREDMVWLDTEALQSLISTGSYAGYVGKRICDGPREPVTLAP